MKIIDPKTGKAPEVHADGIAFDKKGGWLYYHPLTGVTLYRIKTDHLRDETLMAMGQERWPRSGWVGRARLNRSSHQCSPAAMVPKPSGLLATAAGSSLRTLIKVSRKEA